MDAELLYRYAQTSTEYADRAALRPSGVFLNETEDFWRGAAATYALIAAALDNETED